MIKKEAQEVMRELKEMGYKVYLLEGGAKRRSFAVLINGNGTIYSRAQFEKFKRDVRKASDQENGGGK